MTPDMEGVTRPQKDKKTKKFTFILKGIEIGNCTNENINICRNTS